MRGSPKFDGIVCYRKREIYVNSISSKSVYYSRTFDDIIYDKRIFHKVKSKLHCVNVFVRPVVLVAKDSVTMYNSKPRLCQSFR